MNLKRCFYCWHPNQHDSKRCSICGRLFIREATQEEIALHSFGNMKKDKLTEAKTKFASMFNLPHLSQIGDYYYLLKWQQEYTAMQAGMVNKDSTFAIQIKVIDTIEPVSTIRIDITKADFNSICDEMFDIVNALYIKKHDFEDTIEACTTIGQLEAIVINY